MASIKIRVWCQWMEGIEMASNFVTGKKFSIEKAQSNLALSSIFAFFAIMFKSENAYI